MTPPVLYAREGYQLVVLAGHAADKQWWRNFAPRRHAGVLVDGVGYEVLGSLVPAGHPGRAAAERTYGRRHPHARTSADDSLVVIT